MTMFIAINHLLKYKTKVPQLVLSANSKNRRSAESHIVVACIKIRNADARVSRPELFEERGRARRASQIAPRVRRHINIRPRPLVPQSAAARRMRRMRGEICRSLQYLCLFLSPLLTMADASRSVELVRHWRDIPRAVHLCRFEFILNSVTPAVSSPEIFKMSRTGNDEQAPGEPAVAVDVIAEEISPDDSIIDVSPGFIPNKEYPPGCCIGCKCLHLGDPITKISEVEKLLLQKEEELTAKFHEHMEKEIARITERAEFVLQSEQIRASYMLREAHRERKEKITALKSQLESKNLAGLMYVMCTERKRSKIEKMELTDEYTSYIIALQEILTEAQSLILNLARGYKTAARVDREWRTKMAKTLTEFQMFIHDYAKGTPESEQYFFDLPKLLTTEAPVVDNPYDDPCTCDEEEVLMEEEDEESEPEKRWYERIDEPDFCRPFIMFGDMAEFKPPQRREVLLAQKQIKTAPRKWKEYVFHDMFVAADCLNAQAIKDEFPVRAAMKDWDSTQYNDVPRQSVQYSMPSTRRPTTVSIDGRGATSMGSILKIMTAPNFAHRPTNKAMLLGARDSMEIASTTKLREKHEKHEASNVVLNVGKRRTSLFPDEGDEENNPRTIEPDHAVASTTKSAKDMGTLEENENESVSVLGSIHNDSMTVVQPCQTERDNNKIHYEKVCPMEKCQRMQVDSFIHSLPAYMRASPFTHFEQNYTNYEPCTPEQLEILKERIEIKKQKEKEHADVLDMDPLKEWREAAEGVAVQTSDMSFLSLPPCTCRQGPMPSPTSSTGRVYNVQDLQPMKQVLNEINRDCFYDRNIEFNRFKVIGEENIQQHSMKREKSKSKNNRLYEVTKVLKQHPSLLDIFQANAAC